jgi:hypothetical protein
MSELHEMTWAEITAGVRAGTISPHEATQQCAARAFIADQAYNAGLIRKGRPPSQYYSEWVAAFTKMVGIGRTGDAP